TGRGDHSGRSSPTGEVTAGRCTIQFRSWQMKLRVLAFMIVGGVLAVTAHGRGQDKKSDKSHEEKLQGTWSIVAMERMGMEANDEKVKDAKITFTAGRLKVQMDGQEMELNYKLDPAKKPKQIDIIEIGQGGKEQVHQGINKWEGDNVKICFSHAGNARPTE